MNRHKTRPTLEELKQMPLAGLRKEIAQLCVDAAIADHAEVLADAEMLAMDPGPSPERIVELWGLLRGVELRPRIDLKIPPRVIKGRMDDIPDPAHYESPSDNEPNQDI